MSYIVSNNVRYARVVQKDRSKQPQREPSATEMETFLGNCYADLVLTDCIVSGHGTAATDINVAGDSGICIETDLAANGIRDGCD